MFGFTQEESQNSQRTLNTEERLRYLGDFKKVNQICALLFSEREEKNKQKS